MNYSCRQNETDEESRLQEQENGDRRILCRNCSSFITTEEEKIKIHGAAVHFFKNPAGIFFRILCFKNAAGCINFTEYTGEFTWFEDYEWSIVLCRSCLNHLGWHYRGPDDFYGLIADRLSGV